MGSVEYKLSADMLQNIVSNAVSTAIANLNLNNCISPDNNCSDLVVPEGEKDMASKIRKTYYYTHNDREHTVRLYGTSEQELDKKFQEFLAALASDSTEPDMGCSITLEEFIRSDYEPTFLPGLKPTTRQNYQRYIDRYIIPFLGRYPLDEINVKHVQQFMNQMAEGKKYGLDQNLCEKTITRVCGLCSRIFRIAVEMHKAKDIPFKSTLLVNKGRESGHHTALPDAELNRIKENIPTLDRPIECLYMGLLVYTGMRREEILGMRWEDINLDARYATVSRAVTYPDNNHPHVDTPKSKTSFRTVVLAQPLCSILKRYQKSSGFIFGDEEPLCYVTYQRLRRKCFKQLNIVGYNNHDFRATFGTQLKENGLTSAQVADLLGHADTRMVETVYARTRHEGIMKNMGAIDLLNAAVVP